MIFQISNYFKVATTERRGVLHNVKFGNEESTGEFLDEILSDPFLTSRIIYIAKPMT